jgi:T4-like virus tail tube protein gp19
MAFNIDDFRDSISNANEFAYQSKFEARIWVPNCITNAEFAPNDIADTELLALRCDAAELPGLETRQVEFRHYGFIQRVPFHLAYSPTTLSFYTTATMQEKNFFDFWMNQIIDFGTGLADYVLYNTPNLTTNIDIIQYNLMGSPIYTVKLIDAVPISMSPLQLNWASQDIHRFNVTFAYKRWLTPTTDTETNLAAQLPDSSYNYPTEGPTIAGNPQNNDNGVGTDAGTSFSPFNVDSGSTYNV